MKKANLTVGFLCSDELHFGDDDGGDGAILEACTDGCDLIHDLDALGYLTESGVLTVKVRGILMHDEELGGC